MITLTIDIPDDKITEVISFLEKSGVKVHESNLDKLTKEDYQKHLLHQSKANRNKLDEIGYLLKSPANAARLLKSIEDYENGLGQERSLIA